MAKKKPIEWDTILGGLAELGLSFLILAIGFGIFLLFPSRKIPLELYLFFGFLAFIAIYAIISYVCQIFRKHPKSSFAGKYPLPDDVLDRMAGTYAVLPDVQTHLSVLREHLQTMIEWEEHGEITVYAGDDRFAALLDLLQAGNLPDSAILFKTRQGFCYALSVSAQNGVHLEPIDVDSYETTQIIRSMHGKIGTYFAERS